MSTSADGLRGAVVAVVLVGALLLVVAEFTALFSLHTTTGQPLPGHSTSTGSHNDYALIPIAVFVVVLGYGFYVAGSRPALLAIGFMGVLALLIALLGDLPDAHATGLVGGGNVRFVTVTAKPSAGLFMETGGALLLLVACVSGFLLIGAPARGQKPGATPGSPGPDRDGAAAPAREQPLSGS